MKKIIFLLMFFYGGLSYAQTSLPKVSVTSTEPDSGAVTVTANVDKSTFSKNLIKIKYKWLVIDDDKVRENLTIWPDGSRIFFGVGTTPRKIAVILWVGCLFEQNELEFLDPIITIVSVGGNQPLQIMLPDRKFKAAEKTYDLIIQNVPESSRKVCGSLSKSFSSIAFGIGAGFFSDPQDVFKAIRDINSAALNKSGIKAIDFQQWNKLYGDFIYDLYINKKINTAEEWQDLMNETAIGFGAVK